MDRSVRNECVVVSTFRLARRAIAQGVRVHGVSPGPVKTPMVPDGSFTAACPLGDVDLSAL